VASDKAWAGREFARGAGTAEEPAVQELLRRAPGGVTEPAVAGLELLLVDAEEGLEVVLDEMAERGFLGPARP